MRSSRLGSTTCVPSKNWPLYYFAFVTNASARYLDTLFQSWPIEWTASNLSKHQYKAT